MLLELAKDDESSQQLVKGIEMVHASLLQALAEEGVEVIDPKGELRSKLPPICKCSAG